MVPRAWVFAVCATRLIALDARTGSSSLAGNALSCRARHGGLLPARPNVPKQSNTLTPTSRTTRRRAHAISHAASLPIGSLLRCRVILECARPPPDSGPSACHAPAFRNAPHLVAPGCGTNQRAGSFRLEIIGHASEAFRLLRFLVCRRRPTASQQGPPPVQPRSRSLRSKKL